MGGDGIVDPKFVAARRQAGDLATNVGAPAESLPSAKQFIADYQAASYAEPFSAYGVLTYDATNVIIDGAGQGRRHGGTWTTDTRQTRDDARAGDEHRGGERPGRVRPVR